MRIALALKETRYESVPVHIIRDGGKHLKPTFRAINPQARVPAVQLAGGEILIQSPATLEYLDETVPHPRLLPKDPVLRAKVRGVGAIIGCDVHPLDNVSVLTALRRAGQDEAAVRAWIARWMTQGFDAIERLIGEEGWRFGPMPGLADVYVIPQLFSARRLMFRSAAMHGSGVWPSLGACTRPLLRRGRRTNRTRNERRRVGRPASVRVAGSSDAGRQDPGAEGRKIGFARRPAAKSAKQALRFSKVQVRSTRCR